MRWLWPIAFVLALGFRAALVQSYHVPGGDGLQYYRLSQMLGQHRQLSTSEAPDSRSYSRMPGYPLFLAYVAVREAPLGLPAHVERATRANVALDLLTAALALACFRLRRRLPRFGSDVALLGFLAILFAPPMCILASYAMTEPLSTMLATLELLLAFVLLEGEHVYGAAVLTGLVAGLHQLVRADAIMVAPAVAIALLAAPVRWRQRGIAALLLIGVAGAVFAPWPIRNQRVFGHPFLFASYWRSTRGGMPLLMGPIAWARTWASGQPGESYFDYAMASANRLDPDRPAVILGAMYDTPAEGERVVALFRRYTVEGLTPAVDGEFSALAAERRARRPYHVYVVLPLARLQNIWSPVPDWELPMKIEWLGISDDREPFCRRWDHALYALALLGVLSLLRSRATLVLCAMLVVPVVLRSLMLALTVAVGATERHIVEIYPVLVVLALVGIVQRGRRP